MRTLALAMAMLAASACQVTESYSHPDIPVSLNVSGLGVYSGKPVIARIVPHEEEIQGSRHSAVIDPNGSVSLDLGILPELDVTGSVNDIGLTYELEYFVDLDESGHFESNAESAMCKSIGPFSESDNARQTYDVATPATSTCSNQPDLSTL